MNKKNLAVSTITLGIDAGATSIQVESPELLPGAPFKATLQPGMAIPNGNNSEIINVTAKTGNILTVERGIGGTNKAFEPGDLLANGVYVEDLDDIKSYVDSVASSKQDNLVSGTNIKTINGTSVLGNGNIATPNTTYTAITDAEAANNASTTGRLITGQRLQKAITDKTNTKQDSLVSGTNIKTVNGTSVLGSGDIATPNTTYTEISESEITAGTASTARSITGRRAQNIVDKAQEGVVKSETTNNITVSKTQPVGPSVGDIWINTDEDAIPNRSITGDKIALNTVKSDNVDWTTYSAPYYSRTSQAIATGDKTLMTTNFNMKAGMPYLILGGLKRADAPGAGIWEISLIASGSIISESRTESSTQKGASLFAVYTPTSDNNTIVSLTVKRLTGSSNLEIEYANLAVIPLFGI